MHDTPQAEPLSARLKRAQQRAAQARCEAFVHYSPVVAGLALNPITLGSYNALHAMRSAFVTGEPIRFDDVANFVWLHHPEFGQFNREAKRRVTNAVRNALSPSFPALNATVRVLMQFPRFRFLRAIARPTAEQLETEAIKEICRLVQEARRDFPKQDAEERGEPTPYATNAHFLNLFRREFGMTFAETSALPLKQLAQHYREAVHVASKGKAILLTEEEAAIWREHLGPKVAEGTDAAR
jgi:hypothetical protein